MAKAQLEEAEDAAMYTGRSTQSSTTMAATTTPRKSSLSTAYLARRSHQHGDAAEKTSHVVTATPATSAMLSEAQMAHIVGLSVGHATDVCTRSVDAMLRKHGHGWLSLRSTRSLATYFEG